MVTINEIVIVLALAISGSVVCYAYLLRYERRVIARLELGGSPRYGILWPLVDVLRTLFKVPAHRGWTGLRFLSQAFALGATLAAVLLLPWGSMEALLGWAAPLALGAAGSDLAALFVFNWLPLLGMLPRVGRRRTGALHVRSWQAIYQALFYSLPALIAVAGAVLLAGTLSLDELTRVQCRALPLVAYQPAGFIVFVLSLFVSRHLPPAADRPQDQQSRASWLVADYHLQHMGGPMALGHLIDYLHLLFISAWSATIYLGGWCGPWADGTHWLIIKSVLVMLGLLWLRNGWLGRRWLRLRGDSWFVLMILAALNLLLTSAAAYWFGTP